MRIVYSNRTFSKELGQRGLEYMRRFSPDAIARQYANRFNSFLLDFFFLHINISSKKL